MSRESMPTQKTSNTASHFHNSPTKPQNTRHSHLSDNATLQHSHQYNDNLPQLAPINVTNTSRTGTPNTPGTPTSGCSTPLQPPYRMHALPADQDISFQHLSPSHSSRFNEPYVAERPLVRTEWSRRQNPSPSHDYTPIDRALTQFREQNAYISPSQRFQNGESSMSHGTLSFVPQTSTTPLDRTSITYTDDYKIAARDMRCELNHNLVHRRDIEEEGRVIEEKRLENTNEAKKRSHESRIKAMAPVVNSVKQCNSYAEPLKQRREKERLEQEERERIERESNPVEYEWSQVAAQQEIDHTIFETPSRETIEAAREKLRSPLSRMQLSEGGLSPRKSQEEGSLSPVQRLLRDHANRQQNGDASSPRTTNGEASNTPQSHQFAQPTQGRPHWEYMRLYMRLHGKLHFFYEKDISENDVKKLQIKLRKREEGNEVSIQEDESVQTEDLQSVVPKAHENENKEE